MAKTSRKNRGINKNINVQNPPAQILSQANLNKPPTAVKSYDPYQHFKNDLKWSAISAGIVAIVLIIAYLFIH
jgi:hypothetical protein